MSIEIVLNNDCYSGFLWDTKFHDNMVELSVSLVSINNRQSNSLDIESCNTEDVRLVTLDKKDSTQNDIGISIKGGIEIGFPIIVSQIFPDSLASKCKHLHVGDVIMSVNGLSLKDKTHSEAVKILKSFKVLLMEVKSINYYMKKNSLKKIYTHKMLIYINFCFLDQSNGNYEYEIYTPLIFLKDKLSDRDICFRNCNARLKFQSSKMAIFFIKSVYDIILQFMSKNLQHLFQIDENTQYNWKCGFIKCTNYNYNVNCKLFLFLILTSEKIFIYDCITGVSDLNDQVPLHVIHLMECRIVTSSNSNLQSFKLRWFNESCQNNLIGNIQFIFIFLEEKNCWKQSIEENQMIMCKLTTFVNFECNHDKNPAMIQVGKDTLVILCNNNSTHVYKVIKEYLLDECRSIKCQDDYLKITTKSNEITVILSN
ncbi:hypothetical protein A3Q56_04776 [Intoshia linei]|uniref:PDZ domain-containing protein n=1 Tax=Intoshia linei TaxID=1819745 RepID=A0A177AZT4_9BILA|nr:hypothetical protein A3Q56_04776 [Intoshia linei]